MSVRRVMVVEDEAMILLLLVDALADHGIEAIPYTTARAAMQQLEMEHIDALITDIEMPGGVDGLELAQRFDRQHPGLPIIVASGGVRPTRSQLPAHALFIPKPYGIEQVLAALEGPAPRMAA